MDQIGILCRDINAGFDLLSIIAGHDSRDGAMLPHISYSYGPDAAPPKLGVPKNLSNENGFAEKYNCEEFQLEYYETYGHVMDILSSAEIANSISRYDGIKFGYRSGDYGSLNELYVKSRSEGLGPGGKLASVLGALVLSHDMYHPVYERAMKLRRLIRDRLPLDTFGVMALPVTGTADILRGLGALPALAGLWAGSFPVSGGGIQLIAPPGNENKLLKAWEVCTK
jgi:aspartyl-tRNA(Asn)/glutamyl-tRNA(Gln) amidotransferase subunit A